MPLAAVLMVYRLNHFILESDRLDRGGYFKRHDIVCIQSFKDLGGHAMEQRKIAKQAMELSQAAFYNPLITIVPKESNPEKYFFRFVDKNPLFTDNSKNAVCEVILSLRKTQSDFKSHSDEEHEEYTDYLVNNHFHHRNK